jgi:curved DNA-binding protein CbpA
MSAPVAGKFQDHYAILGVEPKANSEVIQAAYAKLAAKYHKDNPVTGDPEKFEAVNLAYEVLCDATLRGEFDKLKGIGQEDDKPRFGGAPFFDNLGKQTGLRAAILSVLYERRQLKPYRPALSMRHLDGMINAGNDELNFALWYLKQRGLVQSDDKSNLQITVEGMDFLESTRPQPELVLPFIKPSALAGAAGAPAAAPVAALPPEPASEPPSRPTQDSVAQLKTAIDGGEKPESVTRILSRALARR